MVRVSGVVSRPLTLVSVVCCLLVMGLLIADVRRTLVCVRSVVCSQDVVVKKQEAAEES